jgi:hypothetical protein
VRKLVWSMLAVTVLLGAVGLCAAQDESKPLVTVSFAGYDKLLADMAMIGQLGGNPNVGKQLETIMAAALPHSDGAKTPLALDTKQPWGAVLFSGGSDPASYGFIPVTDIKPLIALAKMKVGQDIKEEKGVYQIPAGAKTLYAVHKGKWAFVADSAEHLTKVAAEPAPLLGDLPTKYDLAVRASIKNLPKEYREQLLAQLRAGAEAGMQQMPGEDEEAYAMRLGVAKQTIQTLTTLVNDLDNVLLGWNVDSQTKTTYLDLELMAQAGTKLADRFAEIKPGPTNFAGLLLPGAAINANSIGTLSDTQLAQARNTLATLRKSIMKELENQHLTDDEAKLASQLLGNIVDVVQKTLETKKTDAAMTIVLDPAAVTLVAGVSIADGAKLENVLQQLAKEVQKNDQTAGVVKIAAETYQDIHLHVVSLPTPDPKLAPLVGDTLEGVVGVSNDKLLVAVGRDAAKTLKKVIGQLKTTAGKQVPPLEIKLAAGAIAKFVGQVSDNPQLKASAMMAAGMLAKAGDKDHVTITAQPIPQGVRVRLEFEEGLLQAIGSMTQMLGAMTPTAPAGGS